ncbi:MAG: energy transducer TonB [Brevundimonas sp.]
MRLATLFRLALVSAAMTSPPAHAQDPAADWDLTVDAARRATVASLDFGDNVVALRCQAGALDFFLTGTPESTETSRTLQVNAGGIVNERQVWQSPAGGTVLASPKPERLARQLRAGGDLDLRIEPGAVGQPAMRFRLPTPPSAGALDQVLTACGVALEDDWDLLPRVFHESLVWERQVAPTFPQAAFSARATEGSVRMACLVPTDGRLKDCRVISENPRGVGFGDATLAAARRSRVTVPDSDLGLVGSLIQYTVRFRIPG